MLVYRICGIGETSKILESKSLEVAARPGTYFIEKQQKGNINSHSYHYKKSYLHFFKDLPSIFYLYTGEKCICTYDIPEDILEKYKGQGYYMDYRKFEKIEATDEYAIPVEELSFEYLTKVDKINEYIDYEDYLFDPSLSGELETIYQKNKERSRTRKIS